MGPKVEYSVPPLTLSERTEVAHLATRLADFLKRDIDSKSSEVVVCRKIADRQVSYLNLLIQSSPEGTPPKESARDEDFEDDDGTGGEHQGFLSPTHVLVSEHAMVESGKAPAA
jgi:hypothetical protein